MLRISCVAKRAGAPAAGVPNVAIEGELLR
jgi:hypothetical protein